MLEPRKPESFDKPARVYLTTLLPMALMYSVRNYEYTYGYTKEGQIYLSEYFPNALEILYRGKRASLYLCAPENTSTTKIPNEAVAEEPVPVVREIVIEDACEALLEQERMGTLVIHRYHELSRGMLDWIRRVEADGIRKSNLLNSPGPMADYYRTHYPESWAIVEAEERSLLHHGSAVPDLKELKPLSKLHHADRKVVYLSSNIPYILLYIWDSDKTGYSRKWVTARLEDGIVTYEEQFPGQLKAFYDGVSGYIYSALPTENVESVPNRSDMKFSTSELPVYRATKVDNVYQELLRYEKLGLFRVLRFENVSEEKQRELTNRIAAVIREEGLIGQESERACFIRRYFVQAWENAMEDAPFYH